jgi:hypothetical protein
VSRDSLDWSDEIRPVRARDSSRARCHEGFMRHHDDGGLTPYQCEPHAGHVSDGYEWHEADGRAWKHQAPEPMSPDDPDWSLPF